MSALRRRLAARAARREVARRSRPGVPEALTVLYIVPTMLIIAGGGAAGVVVALRWWLGA